MSSPHKTNILVSLQHPTKQTFWFHFVILQNKHFPHSFIPNSFPHFQIYSHMLLFNVTYPHPIKKKYKVTALPNTVTHVSPVAPRHLAFTTHVRSRERYARTYARARICASVPTLPALPSSGTQTYRASFKQRQQRSKKCILRCV